MTKELQPPTGERPRPEGAGPALSSPIPGMDLQTFRNYATRALSGDTGVPAVVLELVGGVRRGGGPGTPEERESDWFREFVWQHAIQESLTAINRLIDRYNEMADWHHAQAEKARGKMREALDEIHEIDEFTSGADDVLKGKETTGKFDRDKAIALLKTRGVKVDQNETEESLAAKLMAEKEKARVERLKCNKQYGDASDDANFHDAQEAENRRKAEELARQRDAILQDGSSPEIQAQKLRTLEDQASLDVELKAATMDPPAKVDQSAAKDDATKQSVNHSQDAQAVSEVSDFEAMAGALTGKFEIASTGVPKEDPQVLPTTRTAPAAAGPSSSA